MPKFKFECSQCGQTLKVDESYRGKVVACPACQQQITIPNDNSKSATPVKVANAPTSNTASADVLEVKPVFVRSLWIIRTFFGTTIVCFFCLIPIGAAIHAISEDHFLAMLGVTYGILWIVLFLSGYFMQKVTYAKTVYRFHHDHLEYSESFLATEDKSLAYSRITETSLRRGIFQQKFGLGTLYLSTPSTDYEGGQRKGGLHIKDVPNPKSIYDAIKQRVGK